MKRNYITKVNGVWYQAGEEIPSPADPVQNEQEKPTADTPKRRGRKTKG